jgi:hypothetical protein
LYMFGASMVMFRMVVRDQETRRVMNYEIRKK